MPNSFTRQELYDLVWSEPMTKLKARFGISDVAVAKICRRNDIPIPNRGYWAKLQAEKQTFKPKLPQRRLGMPETVTIGENRHRGWHTKEQILEMDIPPPPEFAEPVAELRARVKKLVGRVIHKTTLESTHPSIGRLLADDVERLKKQRSAKHSAWLSEPMFQSPYEQRRLAIVNSLFLGLHHTGATATCRGNDPQGFDVRVGESNVSFTLDTPGTQRNGYRTKADRERPANAKLQLQITSWPKLEDTTHEWTDSGAYKIERHLTEIAVEIIVRGEMSHRAGEISHQRWLIERKSQILQDIQEKEAEAKRISEEKIRQAEQAKIGRLLREAKAFRQAHDIRQYVTKALDKIQTTRSPLSQDEIRTWAKWALAEADRLDPVVTGRFLSHSTGALLAREMEPG
jgi:hypothetical protein